MYNLNTKRKTG